MKLQRKPQREKEKSPIINGTVEERGSQAKIRASGSHQHKPHTSNSSLITQIAPITQNPRVTPTLQKQTGGRPVNSQSPPIFRAPSGNGEVSHNSSCKDSPGNPEYSELSESSEYSECSESPEHPQTIRQSSFLKYQEPPTFLPAPDSHATPSVRRGSAPMAHPEPCNRYRAKKSSS